MLESVLDFGDRSVHQVMVPSAEVVFLDTTKSFDENLKRAQANRYTRFPLCEGSLDHVIGIVHVKDFFWRFKELGPGFDLGTVKRPARFVPENSRIKDLLSAFRRDRTHLSLVVDEFGSAVGILTLEDILEELVGEIQDEFDIEMPSPMIRKGDQGGYLVHGRTLLEDVEQELAVSLGDDENDTIGGHVMTLLGRPAKVGDNVTIADQFTVRVVGIKKFQITALSIKKIEE
jgi:CBS domain containing-hemolysin-like protein